MISTIFGYREIAGFSMLVALTTFLVGLAMVIPGITGE